MVAHPPDLRADVLQPSRRGIQALREGRVGPRVVGADHHEHPVARHERPLSFDGLADRVRQLRGVRGVGERGAVEVPERHVLGEDPAPVGRLPPEGVAVDRRRHPSPHDRALDPRLAQDLRHLADVTELVGHVTDLHSPAQFACTHEPPLQVADVRLA